MKNGPQAASDERTSRWLARGRPSPVRGSRERPAPWPTPAAGPRTAYLAPITHRQPENNVGRIIHRFYLTKSARAGCLSCGGGREPSRLRPYALGDIRPLIM